ncbi:glycosyltransferase family 4 protein [Cohnella cholangitidis]|uniref:Glycosyltransferase family 1 protein n=1 Tax=Cohnella cholangitidis TaxID=2598458 RepID=A0A7G5C2I4_9BACL|nr:glycosyltransferase family 1 protein [Cohnella cholangitidis]QMV43418.1 glycosyltransferase family 1 protein [Cohnella cholangitidis]
MSEFRLALFTDTYSPEVNGVAKTLERWIGYLRKQGIECMVFAPSRPRKERTVSEAAERLVSLPFFLYPECRLALPQTGSAERKLLSFKPTVIHVATPFGTGVTGRHLAMKHGIPLMASHHTHFVRYLPFYNLQWMGKLLWRYLHWFHLPCRKIYVPSRSVLEECLADGWEGLELWSRGVDTERFHPRVDRERFLREAGMASSRFVVLYAGRMAPEKQTDVAVEAVARFADRTEADVELVVAGDGPAANDIKALALRRGIQAKFLGSVSQPTLQRWMAASDVLLFPSATETFGNVVLEAMACGLPVVGAAGGAVPDTIRSGENGLLCLPGDVGQFADKLELLYKDASLRARLSAAGAQEAKYRSWDGVFDGLKSSMEEAIGAWVAT